MVRHEYEKAICLEAIKEETLEAAFEVLQKNLDPVVDVFEATQQYRSIVWNVGERLDDFFTKLWQVAIRSHHTNKQVCTTLVTQLPTEVRTVAKVWVLGKGEDAVSDKEVRKSLRIIQETMQQKVIPLGHGARVTEKVAVKRIELEPPREESDNDNNDNTVTNEIIEVLNTKGGRYGQTRRPYEPSEGFREGCYNYGRKGHGWRYCPDRNSCEYCGRKGHNVTQCRDKRNAWRGSKHLNKVLRTSESLEDDEASVTIVLKVNGHTVAAILDTGAKPSVVDTLTIQRLGLENLVVPAKSRVYGLCNSPVQVTGYVEVPIQIVGEKPVHHRIHVIQQCEPTLLLGRQFMRLFSRAVFQLG